MCWPTGSVPSTITSPRASNNPVNWFDLAVRLDEAWVTLLRNRIRHMDLLEVFKDSQDLVNFPAGAVIITEGNEGNHMYVVMEGEVTISLKDKVLATISSGEIVGEMALINSDIRSATVTAKTDCVLALIDQASFNALLRHVPEFALHVMNVLADRLQNAYETIER
jgi:CRP-like cAMP-binding protein